LKYFRGTEKHLRGGYPSPTLKEWLMGWPAKRRDLQPQETDWNQCDSCGKPIYDEEPAVPPAPTFADGMTAEDDRRFLELTNDLTHN